MSILSFSPAGALWPPGTGHRHPAPGCPRVCYRGMFPHERWAPLAAAVLWLLLLHAFFEAARLYAYDFKGKQIWKRWRRREPVWGSLAFAADTIYIRGDKHLFAVREKR